MTVLGEAAEEEAFQAGGEDLQSYEKEVQINKTQVISKTGKVYTEEELELLIKD
jgi:hypothetical protein